MMIQERRAEIAEKLDALHRQRGVAVLDGGKAPASLHQQIVDAERELLAFDEASAEEIRRQQESQANDEAAHRVALQERMTAKKNALLAAVEKFQKAQRETAEAIEDALVIATDMERLAQEIMPGKGAPALMLKRELARRLSNYVSVSLGTSGGHRYRFGDLTLNPAWGTTLKDDWRAHEQRRLDPLLKPFLTEE